jgi:hypothetical protein
LKRGVILDRFPKIGQQQRVLRESRELITNARDERAKVVAVVSRRPVTVVRLQRRSRIERVAQRAVQLRVGDFRHVRMAVAEVVQEIVDRFQRRDERNVVFASDRR